MKQNLIYLAKGLLFSLLTFTALFFLLALLMYQNEWGEAVMSTLLYVAVCLSAFLGSFYFSKHAPAKRFLWGLLFGIAFFAVYFLIAFCLNGTFHLNRVLTTLAFSAVAGMAGGMLLSTRAS